MTAEATPTGLEANMPTRVHLVYPHGNRTSTPDAIGRELGRCLEVKYEVMYHDWSDRDVIRPERGDILLGHPHPHPDTVFRRSLQLDGWHRRLMMAPFNHGDLRQVAFVDSIIRKCDLFLAITGPHWFRTLADSRCSHWQPKMIHLDLAIDRSGFPPLKTSFGAPGERRVLYIGHSGRGKNTSYLSDIAALIPDVEFASGGRGALPIHGLTALGFIDFDSQAGRDLLARFDFFLTVGNADANPTTILEAMSWGLIPICTPTSGYDGIPSIPNVPVDDGAAAAAILRRLLSANESDLEAMQSANWRLLEEHYTWDRFAAQVEKAIESTESPPLGPESLERRLQFTFHNLTSPYGPVAHTRAGGLVLSFRRRWKALRAARTAGTARRQRQG